MFAGSLRRLLPRAAVGVGVVGVLDFARAVLAERLGDHSIVSPSSFLPRLGGTALCLDQAHFEELGKTEKQQFKPGECARAAAPTPTSNQHQPSTALLPGLQVYLPNW
jgi:hypothetical protein